MCSVCKGVFCVDGMNKGDVSQCQTFPSSHWVRDVYVM